MSISQGVSRLKTRGFSLHIHAVGPMFVLETPVFKFCEGRMGSNATSDIPSKSCGHLFQKSSVESDQSKLKKHSSQPNDVVLHPTIHGQDVYESLVRVIGRNEDFLLLSRDFSDEIPHVGVFQCEAWVASHQLP